MFHKIKDPAAQRRMVDELRDHEPEGDLIDWDDNANG